MFNSICTYLKTRGISLSSDDIQIVTSLTKHRKFPKHSILMQQGKVVRNLFFLNRGVVRLFRVHEGNDYTLGLVTADDFISTPLYLLSGELSPCALEALTDIDVLEWSRSDIELIKEKVPKAYDIEQAIMHRLLIWLQDAQVDSLCLTAEERYEKMLREQPELLQTIPLKYIASYFAIHQDSLSRIRKLISQRPG